MKRTMTLEFIKNYIADHGRSPTYAEIAGGIGCKSTCSAAYWVSKLAEDGLIEVTPRIARGIKSKGYK